MNNDEIFSRFHKVYANDYIQEDKVLAKCITIDKSTAKRMLNEARSDERAKLKEQIKLLEAKLHENKIHRQHTEQVKHYTAKQIFKEMESKGVLVHREAIEGTKKNNYVRFKASVYQALKKKHNIEE